MMDRIEGLPFPLAVAILFVVVLLRGNATYWVGRVAHTGVGRTRARELLSSAGFRSAQTLISRWGAPVITVSFLTIGFQTVANLAAGATRMPLRRYLPAMIIGCGLWAIIYATVGFVTFAALRRALRAVTGGCARSCLTARSRAGGLRRRAGPGPQTAGAHLSPVSCHEGNELCVHQSGPGPIPWVRVLAR